MEKGIVFAGLGWVASGITAVAVFFIINGQGRPDYGMLIIGTLLFAVGIGIIGERKKIGSIRQRLIAKKQSFTD
ncbi:hypothetical protein M1373_02230 [Candidatus Marsarchaeota archaeon]|nr:hypothetical protein [Candidatus Marsarchaeota archaeon]MCL5404836.1 hypothetical protein [Candidatus Marsarchaeota archaeon]